MQKGCTALDSAWPPRAASRHQTPNSVTHRNRNPALGIHRSLDSAATHVPARPPAHRHAPHWKSFPSRQGFHRLPENSHKSILRKEPYKTGGRRNMKADKRPWTNTSKGSEPPTIFPLPSTAWDVLPTFKATWFSTATEWTSTLHQIEDPNEKLGPSLGHSICRVRSNPCFKIILKGNSQKSTLFFFFFNNLENWGKAAATIT